MQREPVTITRHGRTAAFVVSAQDMLAFQALQRESTLAAFDAWSQKAAATAFPEAAELTDEDVVRMVKESL